MPTRVLTFTIALGLNHLRAPDIHCRPGFFLGSPSETVTESSNLTVALPCSSAHLPAFASIPSIPSIFEQTSTSKVGSDGGGMRSRPTSISTQPCTPANACKVYDRHSKPKQNLNVASNSTI